MNFTLCCTVSEQPQIAILQEDWITTHMSRPISNNIRGGGISQILSIHTPFFHSIFNDNDPTESIAVYFYWTHADGTTTSYRY